MSNQALDLIQSPVQPQTKASLLTLPAEIRLMILEHAFPPNESEVFTFHPPSSNGAHGLLLDANYKSQQRLQALLLCRSLYEEIKPLVFKHTTFVISNLFSSIPERLSLLPRAQLGSLRHLTFVADARRFRQLATWGRHPFGLRELRLETLTIALNRSSFWHYLFDFTCEVTKLLRRLQGVACLAFVRNGALVKGSFRAWFNRLVGLMMKVDHAERFEREPPCPEEVWWAWTYEDVEERIRLRACPPKDCLDEHLYLTRMLPLIKELRVSVEAEEWNPDPRSRMLYP